MAKRKKKPKKVISPLRRKIRLACKTLLLAILSIIVIGLVVFYIKYGKDIFRLQSEAKRLVNASSEETFKQNLTTQVYDSKGKLICKLKSEKDTYYLKIADIPQPVIDAAIAIEDKQFYSHSGVDFLANIRAAVDIIKHKGEITQGASTITQQLARNIFLSHEVSWERKVEEIFIAMELESRYSKTQILEFYLNNIYFSNGYYGIQAASQGYFSKDVDKLSLSQIAFLIAIPNNPTLYDPEKNIDNTLKRRDRILEQMVDDDKISQDDYRKATVEEITLKQTTLKKQDYVTTFAKFAATEALMEASGFTFRYKFDSDEDEDSYETYYNEEYNRCQQMLFTKGYTIHTSIDMTKQKQLQKALDKGLKKFTGTNDEGIYEMQGSAVCVDNSSGRVVAIVGGRSQDLDGYTLNRAFQSYRQPGSSIKPLIDYLPALQGGYTPSTSVVDEKIEDGPTNSDKRYIGKMTLRRALELSRNTVAYQLFQEFNPVVCMNYLYSMGFHRLTEEDYLGTASIGGLTYGTSALEMASAYATIENDGKYRKPTCIVSITDSDDTSIVSDEVVEKPIYDYNACRGMTDMMEGVLTKGTGRGYALSGMPSAGKTGTTNSNYDGWFIGYTPYYTTSVWVGYDKPKEIKNLEGGTYPLQIWNDFMTTIHKGLDKEEFPSYKKPETTSPSPSAASTKTPQATEPDDSEEPDEPDIDKTASPTVSPKATPTPHVSKEPQKTKTPEPSEEPDEDQEPDSSTPPASDTDDPNKQGDDVDDEIDLEEYFDDSE